MQAEPLANGAHTLAGPGPLGRIEVYSAADNRTSPVTGVRVDGGEYRFDFEPTEGPPDLSRLASRVSLLASRFSLLAAASSASVVARALESLHVGEILKAA